MCEMRSAGLHDIVEGRIHAIQAAVRPSLEAFECQVSENRSYRTALPFRGTSPVTSGHNGTFGRRPLNRESIQAGGLFASGPPRIPAMQTHTQEKREVAPIIAGITPYNHRLDEKYASPALPGTNSSDSRPYKSRKMPSAPNSQTTKLRIIAPAYCT